MSRPVPEHGTRARYMRGCQCLPCRAANARYAAARWRDRRDGLPPAHVPAGETRVHVRRLLAAGWSLAAIGRASGVSAQTIANIAAGDTRRVLLGRANAILAIRIATPIAGERVPRELVRPIIEAVAAAGIPRRSFYQAAGLHPNWSLSSKRYPRVSWETWRRLTIAYRLLSRRGLVPIRFDLEGVSREP